MTWIVSYQFRNSGDVRNRRTRHDSLEDAQFKVRRLLEGASSLTGDSAFSNIRLLVETTETEVLEYHGTVLGPEFVGDDLGLNDDHWPTIQLTSSGDGPNVRGDSFCRVCHGKVGELHDTECGQYRSYGRADVIMADTKGYLGPDGHSERDPTPQDEDPRRMTAETELT